MLLGRDRSLRPLRVLELVKVMTARPDEELFSSESDELFPLDCCVEGVVDVDIGCGEDEELIMLKGSGLGKVWQ